MREPPMQFRFHNNARHRQSSRPADSQARTINNVTASFSTDICSDLSCFFGRNFRRKFIRKYGKRKGWPEVIDKTPKEVAEVSFPSGVKADMGNVLKPTQVKDQPSVKWNADPNALYTVCMTDPDAPSRTNPKFREWHHWLVGNIPGDDISKGDVLTAYVGSGPPKGSGLHRYVILVFKQNKKLSFNEPKIPNTSGDKRPKFSIKKFAEKYDLEGPVAGNFYQAEWDDYVPKLYKQLGS